MLAFISRTNNPAAQQCEDKDSPIQSKKASLRMLILFDSHTQTKWSDLSYTIILLWMYPIEMNQYCHRGGCASIRC